MWPEHQEARQVQFAIRDGAEQQRKPFYQSCRSSAPCRGILGNSLTIAYFDINEKDAVTTLYRATINPQHPRALAFRAVIAHLKNKLDVEKQLRAAALKSWPTNPDVDHTIGRKLSQKYRFAEGSAYQRQALKFDPNYLLKFVM